MDAQEITEDKITEKVKNGGDGGGRGREGGIFMICMPLFLHHLPCVLERAEGGGGLIFLKGIKAKIIEVIQASAS